MVNIYVLTGSVRPGRFNIQPATWIANIGQQRSDAQVELIDLQEVNLPFLDEPVSPMKQQYSKEHTKEWSAKISAADGFIFVTPEYNHGVPPVLKNAVDFLYHEWNHKPVAYVSYGSLAGGSRSVEHWRGTAAELKMFDLREQIMLPDYWDHQDEAGNYQFTDQHEQLANTLYDSLIFWAQTMKPAREELQAQAAS